MENSRHKLRLGDFKKFVRYVVFFLTSNLLVFAIVVALLQTGQLGPGTFPVEFFLVGYFLLFTGIFLLLFRRNYVVEEVAMDALGIHTIRFGVIPFSEVKTYVVFRKRRKEDLVITCLSGRRLTFSPVDARSSRDRQVYESFKVHFISSLNRP